MQIFQTLFGAIRRSFHTFYNSNIPIQLFSPNQLRYSSWIYLKTENILKWSEIIWTSRSSESEVLTSFTTGLSSKIFWTNSVSPVLLSCGIGSSYFKFFQINFLYLEVVQTLELKPGIGLLRNVQSGSHPSFKFHTSKLFFGTVFIT